MAKKSQSPFFAPTPVLNMPAHHHQRQTAQWSNAVLMAHLTSPTYPVFCFPSGGVNSKYKWFNVAVDSLCSSWPHWSFQSRGSLYGV